MTIAVIAGVVGAMAFGVYWWMNRTPHVARDESGVLPLFGGLDDYTAGDPDVGIMEGGTVRLQAPYVTPTMSVPVQQSSPLAESGRRTARTPRVTPQGTPRVPEPVADPGPPANTVPERKASPTIREFVSGGSAATPPSVPASDVVNNSGVPGTMVEGHLLRFSVPAEGTLQFLPGRLEIASGLDAGREIRFVHVPGPDGMLVTFGRSEGELYRHIQLRDQTVSRSHAKLRLDNGQWMLTNFSQTNPVVRNGEVVDDAGEHALEDGDRIEMGEVLFTFRSR